MLKTYHFKSQPRFSNCSLLSNAIREMNASLHCTAIFRPQKSPLFCSSHSLSRQIQTRNSIVCARKRKRRSGSQRMKKSILKLVSIVAAANLKILPPPLDVIVGEFCGGGRNGGGSGFWNGFGGGFDGWRGRGKKKLGLVIFVFLVICGLGLLSKPGFDSAQVWKAWGVCSFGAVLFNNWRRLFKTCILGLCCFGVLVVLGMRKEDRQKWVERFRSCSPVMEIVIGRKGRRRGRAF